MAESIRQRLKPFYRTVWLPFVRAYATGLFRGLVDLATLAGMIRLARIGAEESFLIINLAGHLGDTVMLLPMIEALRQAHPRARIEAAVEASAAPLLRQIDLVDRVHALRLPGPPPTTLWLSALRAAAIVRRWWPLRQELRATTVILPRWGDDLFRSTTLAYLTQAPRRIGFGSNVLPGQRPAPYRDALLTDVVRGASGMHEPARLVYLLEQSALIPLADLGAVSTSPVRSLLAATRKVDFSRLAARLGLPSSYAVVAPGASMSRRIYPVDHWLPAIEHLAANGLATIILAGPADTATAQELQLLAPEQTILVAGTTTLPESAAIIAHAEVFLGNDSGPGHLAGALGTPSIVLFIAEPGCDPNLPAAPERVHPAGPRVKILRPTRCLAPCAGSCNATEAHCISTISPETVVAAVSAVLRPWL